jgi:uncharacterized protein
MLNDAHCHFFSTRFFETLAKQKPDLPATAADVTRLLGWEDPGSAEQLADRWVAELNRNHVSRAALIASVPGDDASVAAAVAQHPDRFVGFFMLDPTQPDAEDRTGRALSDPGMRGVCLFPAMHQYRLDDDRVAAIFGVAASHAHVAVFVHCGVLSVGVRKKLGLPSRFDIRLGDPLALVPAATRHPALPIIVPHFGAGFFREALMAADLCPNIHFDTSSSNGWTKYVPDLTLSTVFRQALDVAGPGRLLFGTDSSFFPRGWQRGIHDVQQAVLQEIAVDDASRAQIFGGNFDRLFPR